MGETSALDIVHELQRTVSQWDLAPDTAAHTEPPTDGGRDAWLVLTSSFVLGAIVWGEYRSLDLTDISNFFDRLSLQLWCLPRILSPSREVFWFSLRRYCYRYNGNGSSNDLRHLEMNRLMFMFRESCTSQPHFSTSSSTAIIHTAR